MRWIALAGCALAACAAPDPTASDGGGDDGPAWAPPDAGAPGAAIEPIDPCDEVAASLYAAPTSLPSARGELIGCAHVETISDADLRARLAGVPGVVIAGGGLEVYLVAFRTERDSGAAAYSTALVVLPRVALAERVPMVLAMHGSVGLADACAPSRHVLGTGPAWLPAGYVDAFFLAWAARGLPVVAPDYAGLGTEGTHAYLSWIDGAISGIDGARALRALVPEGRLDGTTIVYGHSQGGGLALSVGALARAPDASDLDVRAIVAEAPAWRVISAIDALRLRTFALQPVTRVAIALGVQSEMQIVGADPAAAFAAPVRDTVASVADAECYGPALAALDTPSAGYVPPATLGDLIDAAFGEEVATCAGGGACAGAAAEIVARDRANEPHLSADAPPVLVVASTADEAATPGVVGCVIDRVRRDGAAVDACSIESADHLGVVASFSRYAIDWALAAASGGARPPCDGSATPPRCSLF